MSAEAKSAQRRGHPIHGYVGPNGSGKSATAVMDTLASLDAGRRVLSTVRLFETNRVGKQWVRGEEHPNFELLTDWKQLLEAEHCDVFMDEIVGIASSRESQGMPVQVANTLTQLRRRDIVLRWTAPNWARADKIIRECSQAVTECRGMFSDRRHAKKNQQAGQAVRSWTPRRLFVARTFSAVDFEDWTAGKREKLSPDVKQWWWGPGSRVFAAYDTLDSVSRVGEVLDGGRCAHCGGTRARPKCTCDDAPQRPTRRQLALVSADGHHDHENETAPAV